MPLVICRACKSYAGKAIAYITDEERAERITTHGLDDSRSYARQFIETGELHDKGDDYDERKYYHIKISFEPKDRIENGGNLDAERAERIADEYFRENYGNHEYVLATHTDKEHIHCHAIINAVSYEDGKKIQHSNRDLAEMKDRVNDVAERHEVSRFDWREAVREKREQTREDRTDKAKERTQGEKYIHEREGAGNTSSWKEVLREKIDEAKEVSKNREEFEKYLKERYEIEMPRNTERTVSFKHPSVEKTVRGSKLGGDYTAESIDEKLRENEERSNRDAELRDREERAGEERERGDNAGASDEIHKRDIVPAHERERSAADESGERATERNVDELYEKLHEIRGIDKEYNPDEQRRATEAAERASKESREEIERVEKEQRGSERDHRGNDR
jgi:hypothetical protein